MPFGIPLIPGVGAGGLFIAGVIAIVIGARRGVSIDYETLDALIEGERQVGTASVVDDTEDAA